MAATWRKLVTQRKKFRDTLYIREDFVIPLFSNSHQIWFGTSTQQPVKVIVLFASLFVQMISRTALIIFFKYYRKMSGSRENTGISRKCTGLVLDPLYWRFFLSVRKCLQSDRVPDLFGKNNRFFIAVREFRFFSGSGISPGRKIEIVGPAHF